MAGGLLNLIANTNSNNANIYFIGNPTTCFFYTTYNQFCNFGVQNFRIDYNGSNTLQQNTPSYITFNISRFADLLTDTYLVLTLPDIFSPVYRNHSNPDVSFSSFDFKWIKDIGTNIIREVTIKIDGDIIQQYSGAYIKNVVERDYDSQRLDLFNQMTGNVAEIHSPARTTNTTEYPNSHAIYPNSIGLDSYPSIKSRQLFIPVHSWFSLTNYLAFPLIALQYQVLSIEFTLRPLNELYIIRDLNNINPFDHRLTPYIRPPGPPLYNLATFTSRYADYLDSNTTNTDNSLNTILPPFNIHMLCRQVFLSEEQRNYFAKNQQQYIFRDIREHITHDIVASNKIEIVSHALVSGWMWYLQRSDIKARNEWSNYTNLEYENYNNNGRLIIHDLDLTDLNYTQNPAVNDTSGIFIRPVYDVQHETDILTALAIVCDGAYREQFFSSGVYRYLDVYKTCNGSSKRGLYFYSFTLENDSNKIQPYGFFNTNFFKKTELEFTTLTPNIDPTSNNVVTTCDEDGNIISVSKSNQSLYEYTYTFTLQEERYNIITFASGMASLQISR